jgi:Helix-turn-helix domain
VSAPPVTDAERTRIRQLHARGLSCAQIAAELGRSKSAVSRQCAAMGLRFDREQTKAATAAVVADSASLRAQTGRRFLDKCNHLLDMMDEPFTAFNFGGKDNTYEEHEFDKPPVDALRSLMQSAAQAFDKHMAQDKHDADAGNLNDVDAWLAWMSGEEG